MNPVHVNKAVLDMARVDRCEDWQEANPELCEMTENLDAPVVEIVWHAAWNAALEARERLEGAL